MSRSVRPGISYFSLDVDMFSDRKVRRLIRACGAQAYTVLMRVLCGAYDEAGYYIAADDDLYFDLAGELMLPEEFVKETVACCISEGIFDSGLFERHKILTSRRMQRNYLDATRRRMVKIAPEYLLVDVCDNAEIACNKAETECDNADYDSISTQIKEKKTKAEESKEKESKEDQNTDGCGDALLPYGEYVYMNEDQYKLLCIEYGERGAQRMVEILDNYKGATGKKYASDFHAILSWVVKRWQEEREREGAGGFERETENYDYLAEDLFADSG